ncbi:MAG: hypothetical protein V1744_03760 [Candidatus Altiarchaeota archaeon]
MTDLVGKFAGYLGMLGHDERTLILSFAILAVASLSLNLTCRFKISQLVLSQPADQPNDLDETQAIKNQLVEKSKSTGNDQRRTAPKNPGSRASSVCRVEWKAEPKNVEYDSIALGACSAVAEMDFIEAVTCEDVKALHTVFGFVCVPREIWPEARSALDLKGLGEVEVCGAKTQVFVKAEANNDDTPYASVAIARETPSVVLSDSENIRRTCKQYGIPCMNSAEWRVTARKVIL